MSGLDAPLALPAVPDSPSSIDDPSLLDSSLLPTTDQALSDALANELANLLDPLLEIDDGVTEETFLQGSMAPMVAIAPDRSIQRHDSAPVVYPHEARRQRHYAIAGGHDRSGFGYLCRLFARSPRSAQSVLSRSIREL
jgi:hypothetical protein